MTIQERIREYLETSGVSKRALSLQAGLNPRAVQDILDVPGIRSDRRTLDALADVMGVALPTPTDHVTYARLISDLSRATGDKKVDERNRVLVSRLRKFLAAAGWIAETEIVDRRRAVEKLSRLSAAMLGVSTASFATYKSDILAAISRAGGHRRHPRCVRPVSGFAWQDPGVRSSG